MDRTSSRFRIDVRQLKAHTRFEVGTKGQIGCDYRMLSFELKQDSILLGTDPKFDDVQLVESPYKIWLDRTPCHFGGMRNWFKCPSCEGRVGTLFLNDGGFACRKCCDLAFSSQLECRPSRLIGKAMRIRRRLGDTRGFFAPTPDIPKGMHLKTYWRYLLQLRETEEAFSLAMLKRMYPDRPHWNALSPSVERAFAELESASDNDSTTSTPKSKD